VDKPGWYADLHNERVVFPGLLVDQITGARRTDQQLLECFPMPGATVGPV
jgi:hypothetical protein